MIRTEKVRFYAWRQSHSYPKGNSVGIHNFDQTPVTVSNQLEKGAPVRTYKLKIARGEYAGSFLNWIGTSFVATPLYAEDAFPDHVPMQPSIETAHSSIAGVPYNNFITADPGASSTSIANTAALTSLTKRLSSELTTFQGGVFVGELKEAIHLIRHPLSGLSRGLSRHLDLVAKRAKRVRKMANMRRMVTETWLETSFGLRPLVADIDNAADALAQFVVDPTKQEFKTLTSQGYNANAKDQSNDVPAFGIFSGTISAYSMRTRSSTVKYLACIGVSPSVRSCAFQKVGLNFANFVPTLWELMPYSFVVDYFTNVGDVISGLANLSANVRWVIKWTIVEDKDEIKNFFFKPTSSTPFASMRRLKSGTFSVSSRNIIRDTYTGSLIPDFRWELPGETSLKWLNLAALATQMATTRHIVQTPARTKLTLLRKGTF